MKLSLFSHILVLSFVADGLTNLVILQKFFCRLPLAQKFYVILRESFFALISMFILLFVGQAIIRVLSAPQASIEVVSGFIIILLGIRAILGLNQSEQWTKDIVDLHIKSKKLKIPLVSPIALPLVIGPSWFSYLLTLTNHTLIHNYFMISCSWIIPVALLLTLFVLLGKFVTQKVCETIQTITGLLITVIGVQLFIHGLQLTFL